MTEQKLADLRRDFSRESLSRSSVDNDPFAQFSKWMTAALASEIVDATAMVLSTVSAECRPSSRVVLLKGFDETGLAFYTNYQSKKGRDLAENPYAALHFFWPELERQVNISGVAAKLSTEESEAYFQSRPAESRIGAWASHQSEVLASREVLETRVAELRKKFAGKDIPLPPFWGGYRLAPEWFEFWQGRPNRLHDRICYQLSGGQWQISRLSP
ncbi:MAG TPA: pyridoxamine 5'-phosphate oxidase [Pyrinomonadaceae bacterium]|nr:pyridoxamine 5'-phosphate oxidase [Pyrinomonadaceae bacterium]